MQAPHSKVKNGNGGNRALNLLIVGPRAAVQVPAREAVPDPS